MEAPTGLAVGSFLGAQRRVGSEALEQGCCRRR
jgi:hypothetical protein